MDMQGKDVTNLGDEQLLTTKLQKTKETEPKEPELQDTKLQEAELKVPDSQTGQALVGGVPSGKTEVY